MLKPQKLKFVKARFISADGFVRFDSISYPPRDRIRTVCIFPLEICEFKNEFSFDASVIPQREYEFMRFDNDNTAVYQEVKA